MNAVFPGSFDPLTNGHLDIIVRSSQIFDKVIVAVMTNTKKKSLFTANEKVDLISEAIFSLANVEVVSVESDLTINLMHQLDAKIIIRSVRNNRDFEYEKDIALMNKELDETVETVLMLANPKYAHISSSLMKEIFKFDGDISNMVPNHIKVAMLKKRHEVTSRED
ncbi:pantetheine-phosphate adenylyltransferase [Dellaglioa sp. P0083]|uniref:pantetheine-phosphate adenylyltransferase n=1 Tax=Dellaglioa kimchii TaxID=3344667 RepID=UPI0038D47668